MIPFSYSRSLRYKEGNSMWRFLTAHRWFLWKLVKSHSKILWLFFPWLCPHLPTPLVSLSWKKASSHKLKVSYARKSKPCGFVTRSFLLWSRGNKKKKKNSKCGIQKKNLNNTYLISKKNCLHTVSQMLLLKAGCHNSSKNLKASPVSILWKNALRSPQHVTVIGGGNIYP